VLREVCETIAAQYHVMSCPSLEESYTCNHSNIMLATVYAFIPRLAQTPRANMPTEHFCTVHSLIAGAIV